MVPTSTWAISNRLRLSGRLVRQVTSTVRPSVSIARVSITACTVSWPPFFRKKVTGTGILGTLNPARSCLVRLSSSTSSPPLR
ncbi:hypothetical protein D3C71_1946770 [compost metagenome]